MYFDDEGTLEEVMIGLILARKRTSTGRDLTKAHLVESVVNDGPVTRCGRTLAVREGTHFGSSAGNRCKVCIPHQRI